MLRNQGKRHRTLPVLSAKNTQLYVITQSIYRRYFVPLFTSTAELHLPEPLLSGWPIIGIGFALRLDLLRILQSYFP